MEEVCVLADENHLMLLSEIPNFRIFGLCPADVEHMLALNALLNKELD